MYFKALFGRMTPWKSALAFAAIAAGALYVGFILICRVLESENRAFVQQSIGDTTATLAAQSKLEMERLAGVITEIGQNKLRPMAAAAATDEAAPGAVPSVTPVLPAKNIVAIEMDPEIAEISYWSKPDSLAPAMRRVVAVNPRSSAASPRWISDLEAREGVDRKKVESAFHGHRLVLADVTVKPAGLLVLVAVPLGYGEVTEILSAHVSLEKLQAMFATDRLAQAFLVDAEDTALVHFDPESRGERGAVSGGVLAPIWNSLRQGQMESAQLQLADESGEAFFGGYRRVGFGALTVIASVPSAQGVAPVAGLRAQFIAFVLIVSVLLALGRYWLLTRPKPATAEPQAQAHEAVPRKKPFVALHGTLRGFNQLLDAIGAEETTEALNDFLTLAASRVRAAGGVFEKYSGVSFVGSWELPEGSAAEAMDQAIDCAIRIQQDSSSLNEARKLDGKRPLSLGLGMHAGQALAARVGPASETRYCVTGEAIACARALDRLGLSAGWELVISHEVLKSARGAFSGKALGEARLTDETGLTAYYAIQDYQPEQAGQGALVDAPGMEDAQARLTAGETRVQILAPEMAPARWLVNNGSRIVGPFTAQEIAQRLFTQELDFDCECWNEENGRSALIREAAIFSGSEDAGARLWVYDGQTIHGPVSEGFLRTALQHGAIPKASFVCTVSTIEGWKPLQAFLATLTARKPDAGSPPAAA